MKKKLALLLSAVMVLGSLPMTAFASTTNTVSRIVTAQTDTVYQVNPNKTDGEQLAPVLSFTEREVGKFSEKTSEVTFKATLENAEWAIEGASNGKELELIGPDFSYPAHDNGYGAETDGAVPKVTKLSAKQAIFTLPVELVRSGKANEEDKAVYLPLEVKLTDEGDGKITIDAMESNLTSGTYRFANIVDSDVSVSIADTTKLVEAGKTIETIVITENTAGSLRAATGNARVRIRLTSGFEFEDITPVVAVHPSTAIKAVTTGEGTAIAGSPVRYEYSKDGQDLYLYFDIDGDKTSSATTISVSDLKVKFDEDDVAIGRVCEATVSGAGISKSTIEVGTATTYGITWEAENKTLPILYSGRADENEETLEVTFKEIIGDSWLAARKTTITFPEGVKVMDCNIGKHTNVEELELDVEDNVVTLKNGELTIDNGNKHKKATMEMTFTLSIAPKFEGDVVATLGGAGVEGELEATVATVVSPVTVEAEVNEVSIDYRKVAVSDITITEAFAGALEKGKVLQLSLDKIDFDDTPKIEVTKGDLVVEKVSDSENTLALEVKYASSKEASTIKLSGISLFLDRSIPAGKYDLKLSAYGLRPEADAKDYDLTGWGTQTEVNTYDPDYASEDCTDAYFQTSVANGAKYKGTIYFDSRSKVVVPGYVDVVTAGRDQDDSTFTTQLVVQVGASTMTAGKQTINLDVPAYIKNGYTMLPVRAITEALSSVAAVNWDDPTHTVTIQFGSRIIKMAVGSKTMVINGVEVAMASECEITDSRAFIPLRDLGYALGLNDSKINWDDATKTATLN